MRNITIRFCSILFCIFLLCPALTASAEPDSHAYTAAEVENFCGGIAAYKAAACGASTVQEWIDSGLCANAGTVAEFYAITLSQCGGYDLSRYQTALLSYLDRTEIYSATTREKYALALLACGSRDAYIQHVCDSDIGGQGLMSLVFGLHLLNNGCRSALYTVDALIGDILSRRLGDGGWAVIGSNGDVDVTAMTIQALAPYYGERSDVTAAVDGALSLLSSLQLDSGGFRSMGAENCESAAQVLTTLSSLGIDQNTDSRFIKNGFTVLDAMLGYRNADGSFAHTGGGFNESATMQAFYAMRAFLRMRYGQSPLYILDRRPAPVPSTQAPVTEHHSAETTAPAPTKATQPAGSAPATQPPTQSTEASAASESTPTPDPTQDESPTSSGAPVLQPVATGDETATPDEPAPQKGGYKLPVIIGVLIAGAGACAILFLRKKRGLKHYLAVLILVGAAIVFLLLTNFESPASYSRTAEKAQPVGAVTMTISCSVLSDEDGLPQTIPDDFILLPETRFSITEGETAYDILLEASKRFDIRIDNRGSDTSAYIAGIAYLYELDYGELSGWMYRANGVFPEVGCQAYVLHDGDRIEWLYTKNIGKDL